jgi:type IV pilus assembly protein PilA
MKCNKKNQKGFTLVEVIVVAVIVAVLAAVAIPLYIGYINDANANSATNAAGSAASFLAAARNSQGLIGGGTAIVPLVLTAGLSWSVVTPAPNSQTVTFTCPDGVTITAVGNISPAAAPAGGGSVTAQKGGFPAVPTPHVF